MVTDRVRQTYWVYTNQALYEVIVQDEDRDVWKLFIEKRNFEEAFKYAKTSLQKDQVVTSQAEYYFDQKKYELAANCFAQSKSIGFENVALQFLDRNEIEALIVFLKRKLDLLKKTVCFCYFASFDLKSNKRIMVGRRASDYDFSVVG